MPIIPPTPQIATQEILAPYTEPTRPDAPVTIPKTAPKRPDNVTDEQTGEEPDRDDFSGFEFIVRVKYGASYHENNWSQTFIHPAPARQLFDLLKSQIGVNNVIISVVMDQRTVGDWVGKYVSYAKVSQDD